VLAASKKASTAPTVRHRLHLRRHMGFVANNLGVLLEDLGKEGRCVCRLYARPNALDPRNISVLFNGSKMARRGAASGQRQQRVDRARA
jgi:hypothetical protein